MKIYDFRFDQSIVKTFIGDILTCYKHAEFIYTNSVTGAAGFSIGNNVYMISNEYETLDFFGLDEEATVYRLNRSSWDEIDNVINNEVSENIINERISKIVLVNDHTTLKSNGTIEYDMWDTKAIIFYFNDYEICFMKQDCWFSQEIEVFKGYNLLSKVGDGKGILEDFEGSNIKQVSVDRDFITIE